MCRFVAYRGAEIPLRTLVFGGTHPLYEQAWAAREMLSGSSNADGWGVTWYPGGDPIRLARPEPIWHATELRGLLATQRSGTALAALRNASSGMPLGVTATSPLVLDQWSFTLNGFVNEYHERFKRAFHSRLSDDLYARLRNGNDTETLFFLAVQAAREGADPADALAEVVEVVRDAVASLSPAPEAQLNMALSDGKRVAVCRASTVQPTNSLYLARSPSLFPGGTVAASEALDDDPAWAPVEPGTVVLLDEGGEIEMRRLRLL